MNIYLFTFKTDIIESIQLKKGDKSMKKSNVFDENNEINCAICGKNLIDNINNSMVNVIINTDTNKIVSVIPCCKGECDDKITSDLNTNEVSNWQEFSHFTNPYLYLKNFISAMNLIVDNKGFDNKKAFKDYQSILINMYPYVSRDLTEKEISSANSDNLFQF